MASSQQFLAQGKSDRLAACANINELIIEHLNSKSLSDSARVLEMELAATANRRLEEFVRVGTGAHVEGQASQASFSW